MTNFCDVIAANPNPRTLRARVQRFFSIAWGHKFATAAALEALKTILAGVGLGTLCGDFATMHLWLMVPFGGVAGAAWYGLYLKYRG